MENPKKAGDAPKMENLVQGQTYAWCACGQSKNQPWCDGSHQVTSFTPTVFVAEDSKAAALCMCKQSKNKPFCDGTHMSL